MQTREMVDQFFNEAHRALGEWVREHDGSMTRGLTHVDRNGKLAPTTSNEIYGFFWATVDFATPHIVGTISFGDRDISVDMTVASTSQPERHGLWEWAQAVDRRDLVPHDSFVTQPDHMSRVISSFAHALRELADVIAQDKTEVLQRIAADRAFREQAERAVRRDDRHHATRHDADEAFRLRDWSRVVSLLESIEDPLTTAEEAKLSYARRRASP